MNPLDPALSLGRTIQLYLVDGTPNGLILATLKGWTGSVLLARNSTLPNLLRRPEAARTGIYILYGPDPNDELMPRAYIGEAEEIASRLPDSTRKRAFWELVAIVTTSDESLTKGHVRYLEARLIQRARETARVTLDNTQLPDTERRYLPEADLADMEYFLRNLEVVLPIVGMDLLKPRVTGPRSSAFSGSISSPVPEEPVFIIEHKSGARASAVELESEFVVLAGSTAVKGAAYTSNSYTALRSSLIEKGALTSTQTDEFYHFVQDVAFKSPSAAAAVVLDRNSNGRVEWRVQGSRQTYHEWQQVMTE
ncbi:GIY-YIG nuclease family protein [Lichenibacterium ramalinae]|uniref:GIY-YIG nuclease family protein n=1 Tax=Lichenibacterium ramalinae TaxID=2316527 RepID=A0A4Q2R6A5_9HYPH|nr:GIY-YIG nuclease family protein [Lichenibacterium ramalinae]RYB01451.1 GIY-YIG nuclease family protein [Lichenibacterium ramalinae]